MLGGALRGLLKLLWGIYLLTATIIILIVTASFLVGDYSTAGDVIWATVFFGGPIVVWRLIKRRRAEPA